MDYCYNNDLQASQSQLAHLLWLDFIDSWWWLATFMGESANKVFLKNEPGSAITMNCCELNIYIAQLYITYTTLVTIK